MITVREDFIGKPEKRDNRKIPILQRQGASVLQDLGEYAEAKLLVEKTLAFDEKNFDTDHPTTAKHYSSLAIGLMDLDEYPEVGAFAKKGVGIL